MDKDAMEEEEIVRRIGLLRQEHRDLDDVIDAMMLDSPPDQMQLARSKKRKLKLKDDIAALQAMLIPDIIA